MEKLTYQTILDSLFKEFKKLNMLSSIKDVRPCCPFYTNIVWHKEFYIPNTLIVWLDNNIVMLYNYNTKQYIKRK